MIPTFRSFFGIVLPDIKIVIGGDIPHEDKKMNDSAVKNNDDRIVARYNDIYIITEWDRSATTILFIDEY